MFSAAQELAWCVPALRNWKALGLKPPANDFQSDQALPESPPSPPSSTLYSASSFRDGPSHDSSTPTSESTFSGGEAAPWMKISGFREELQKVWDEYVDTEEIKIVAATWNLAGISPPENLNLDDWLSGHDEPPADIYVIGFQEIIPLTASNVLNVEVEQRGKQWDEILRKILNKEQLSFVSLPLSPLQSLSIEERPGSELENSATSNGNWGGGKINYERIFVESQDPSSSGLSSIDSGDSVVVTRLDLPKDDTFEETEKVSTALRKPEFTHSHSRAFRSDFESVAVSPGGSPPLKNPRKYLIVASKQMVGIHIVVWIRAPLYKFVKNVKISRVGVGLLGFGNKGSVAVTMSLHESTFCFINGHLAAGDKEGDIQKRILDVQEVLRRTQFSWDDVENQKQQLRKSPETIQEHDHVIWVGDFNFRLELPDEEVRKLVSKQDWNSLICSDRLRKELSPQGVLSGWKEGPIGFGPTYKYVMHSNKYIGDDIEDGEKRRTPAWCDRVLCLGKKLELLEYKRSEISISDHRPVAAVIKAKVNKFLPWKLKEALEIARIRLDAQAQRSMPQCDVEPNNITFGDIKYAEEVARSIELRNKGVVTANFSVEAVQDGNRDSPIWVSPATTKGVLEPGDCFSLGLKALVLSPEIDLERVVDGGGELNAILVVNVEGGGSKFLSCSAKYLPSCWGLSLDALASISGPVRTISSISRQTHDHHSIIAIPKEVQKMVTYLLDVGVEASNAFDSKLLGVDPSDWDSPPNQPQISTVQSQESLKVSLVSWQSNRLILERKIGLLRETLDTGESFPSNTNPQIVGTALVLFLRALPQPLIPCDVTEVIDSMEGSSLKQAPMAILEKVEGFQILMMETLLVLLQALLRNRIANHFAVREVAAVFASAIFSQTGPVDRKVFRGRARFLQQLIHDRLSSH